MSLIVDVAARMQGGVHVSSVVRLIGSLDPGTTPIAEKEVKPLLASGPNVLIFDLSGVDFVTSTGVGFLLSSKAAIEKRGGACYLSGPSPQIRKVLEIMKALPKSTVFSSVKELDEYLAEMQRKVEEDDSA